MSRPSSERVDAIQPFRRKSAALRVNVVRSRPSVSASTASGAPAPTSSATRTENCVARSPYGRTAHRRGAKNPRACRARVEAMAVGGARGDIDLSHHGSRFSVYARIYRSNGGGAGLVPGEPG